MARSLTLLTGSLLALAAGVAMAAPVADRDGDRVFDHLEARLAGAEGRSAFDVRHSPLTTDHSPLVPVIVRYKNGRLPAQVAGASRGATRLAFDGSVATRLTAEEIRRVAASGAVESIEADLVIHATRAAANASFGVTQGAADFGVTGDGDGDPQRYSPQDHPIAVIDSGIDGGHQDFAGGKIIAWKDFVNGRTTPYDDDGHGTHCASIAAGAPNAQGERGVAPGAALIGLKALDENGSGSSSRIAQAVNWCIEHKAEYGIAVVSMSLGSDGSSDGKDLLSRTVNRAVAAGLVVCVSAGNEGPNPLTIGSPGAAADVITVGNMADVSHGGFVLIPSSSRGPTLDGRVKPDLCAPGFQIRAAKANTTDGYVRFTGTSMAAPSVAGVAALLRQANPNLTPAAIKALLKETAVPFGAAGENNEFGAGRLDGYAALAKAAGRAGAAPVVPAHRRLTGALLPGAVERLELTVTDTRFPIGLTLIIESRGADFDLEVLDPEGHRVAQAVGNKRQETAAFRPQSAGVYTVVIRAYAGSGGYALDVSGGR